MDKANIGIFTKRNDWNAITGGSTLFGNMALGYRSENNQRSFDDFQTFGGWTKEKVIAKTYAKETICDLDVMKVHYMS